MRKLRIKSEFFVIEKDNQYIISSNDNELIKNTIYLDDFSLFLWNSLKEKELSQNEMLTILLEKFKISKVLTLSEVDKFVKTLLQNEIIE